MIAPTTPKDEKERLKSLDSFKILETLPEKEYDNLTRLASQICGTPIALISLITEDKQWFNRITDLMLQKHQENLLFVRMRLTRLTKHL